MTELIKKLYVETTSRCNISCAMCVKSFKRGEEGDMSLNTFKRLLPVLREVEYVNLNGIGEPLMNPEFLEILKFAKDNMKKSSKAGFTTNGMLLNGEMAEKLVLAGLDKLVISLDSVNPESFSGIRVGACFKQVELNIDSLNMAKKKLGRENPVLGFELVATKENFHEIPQVVEFAYRKGAKLLIFSHIFPYSPDMNLKKLFEPLSNDSFDIYRDIKAKLKDKGLDINKYANFNFLLLKHKKDELSGILWDIMDKAFNEAKKKELFLNIPRLIEIDGDKIYAEAAKVFSEASRLASEYNIELIYPPIIPEFTRECKFIKDGTCFVGWDGDVSTCLRVLHENRYFVNGCQRETFRTSFGNINEQDIVDIWKGKKYSALREKVARFGFPNCLDCSAYDSCGYFKDNFNYDCYGNEEPCADCLWSKKLLHCL